LAQGFEAIGHQPFAASFVDRRPGTVKNSYTQPLSSRGNRVGKSRGPAADNQYICIVFVCAHLEREIYKRSAKPLNHLGRKKETAIHTLYCF
jgi:hypothetical protein